MLRLDNGRIFGRCSVRRRLPFTRQQGQNSGKVRTVRVQSDYDKYLRFDCSKYRTVQASSWAEFEEIKGRVSPCSSLTAAPQIPLVHSTHKATSDVAPPDSHIIGLCSTTTTLSKTANVPGLPPSIRFRGYIGSVRLSKPAVSELICSCANGCLADWFGMCLNVVCTLMYEV